MKKWIHTPSARLWLAGKIWVDFEIFKIISLAYFMAFNEVHNIIVLPMHISWFSRVKLCVLEVHNMFFMLIPLYMYVYIKK